MATSKKCVDRRIQRKRQVLQQAFIEVVREKGFAAMSIQEIAVRANINRGTFYLHFADKYMLLDAFIREDFQRLLSSTFSPTACWDRETLHLLIQTMLDHFGKKYKHQRLPPTVVPLLERAVQAELTVVLLTWLKQGGYTEKSWYVPLTPTNS